MAIINGYLTLEEAKSYLDITHSKQDAIMERAIGAASRRIDSYCHRHFYQVTETRYFDPDESPRLVLPDFVELQELATDPQGNGSYSETWEATDYLLEPADGPPYSTILIHPEGRYTFPRIAWGVKVTATWGWPSVPDDIVIACLLLMTRLWKRKDAPFGVTGSPELGQLRAITKVDPDVSALLDPYKRYDTPL